MLTRFAATGVSQVCVAVGTSPLNAEEKDQLTDSAAGVMYAYEAEFHPAWALAFCLVGIAVPRITEYNNKKKKKEENAVKPGPVVEGMVVNKP